MGIKFHCPNGHKMNVKSFLAGKKGKCPKCGVGVDIPLASENAAGQGERAKSTVATAGKPASVGEGDVNFPAFGVEIGEAAEPAVAPATFAGIGGPSAGSTSAKSSRAVPGVITEDPLAQWYTCTQSGERYGPVSGEVMQMWLGEGRVAADSLVWRDGWTDWKRASAVFPSLSPVSALAGLPTGLTDSGLANSKPAAEQPKMDDLLADALAGAATSATTYISTSRRRSHKDKMVLTSMVLIGAVTLLAVALLLVVLNQ